jgi:hypothetical protein
MLNPNADDKVDALAVAGPVVYAGGWFTSIGGKTRTRIAALDSTSGVATAWRPNASRLAVFGLAVNGSVVYAAGDFTSIGGQPRNNIAALDSVTGAATAWNPDANKPVRALAVAGSLVYAGGDFTSIGGPKRRWRLAALDRVSGLAKAGRLGRLPGQLRGQPLLRPARPARTAGHGPPPAGE